jgi:hypothetical protein
VAVGVGIALLREPGLVPVALRQLGALAPHRWWARPPFLPVPDPAAVRFRIETHRGAGGIAEAADVVTWLRWCAAARR